MAVLLAALAVLGPRATEAKDLAMARAVKVTTLSTMLADEGLGEWGYSALVEVDGRKVLFDSGANPDVVLHNARAMGIDLSDVEDVIISHFHDDHTGGLMTLRKALMAKNPKSLSRLHVGEGIFAPRFEKDGKPANTFPMLADAFRASGGQVIVHAVPTEIVPGAWLTGPVPRHHAETNWNPGLMMDEGGKRVADYLPEDSSLVMPTAQGSVIVTGCGHAGIMNIADAAQAMTGNEPLLAVIGGVHLFAKPDAVLVETAARLKGLRYLLGGHCTGIEATVRLRELLALDRHTAVVAAVGSRFVLGKGIDAGMIAGWAG
ncbi:MBL fold metallo-hydrolase [Novosphingobium cyanobacteriorum]|nr:MBL fold metallo-hydrolase [Novosphingobium cyanobacteriorum]